MRRVLLAHLGRIFARFHLWMLAAYTYEQAATQDEASLARLSYPLLMASERPAARRLFVRLLRRHLDHAIPTNLALAAMAQRFGKLQLAALIYRRTSKLKGDLLQLAAANSMARLAQGLFDHTLQAALASAAARLNLPAQDAPLILVPVGSNYLDMFRLWIEQTRQHAQGTILALALDPGAGEIVEREFACKVLDLSSYFVFDARGKIHPNSRQGLWILRVLILRELVARGHAVLSLDLDAILVGDLDPMLASFPPVDIVAQQDYSIPVDVARELGFILCCGFMLFRPTPATVALLDRYTARTNQELDDQLALNHLISGAGVTNLQKASSYLTFQSSGATFLCPDRALVSRDITYGTVLRHFQQHGQTIPELRSELGLIE